MSSKGQRQKRHGRVSPVTECEKRQIVRPVSVGMLSALEVKEKMQLECNVRTIQRIVKKIDWFKYKKISAAPALTKRHMEVRVKWTEKMALLDDVEWCQVVFSDEKKWNLDGSDEMRCQWVNLRRPEETNVHRHSDGGLVMIWGGFAGCKKTELEILNGAQDSAKYMATLRTHLQPFIDHKAQNVQQDNALCHKSRVTLGWLRDQGIQALDRPALSPNPNPIENVWGIMTQHVYADGRQYVSLEQPKRGILKAWELVPAETLEEFALSI